MIPAPGTPPASKDAVAALQGPRATRNGIVPVSTVEITTFVLFSALTTRSSAQAMTTARMGSSVVTVAAVETLERPVTFLTTVLLSPAIPSTRLARLFKSAKKEGTRPLNALQAKYVKAAPGPIASTVVSLWVPSALETTNVSPTATATVEFAPPLSLCLTTCATMIASCHTTMETDPTTSRLSALQTWSAGPTLAIQEATAVMETVAATAESFAWRTLIAPMSFVTSLLVVATS